MANWKETTLEKPDVKHKAEQEFIFEFIGEKVPKEFNIPACQCTSKVFINNKFIVKFTPSYQSHIGGERQPYERQVEVVYTDESKEILTFKGHVVQ